MLAPPLPEDEADRLASLRALALLDSPAEERFDRVTRLARTLFGAPMAALSLVDAERQWFKASCGLDARETSRQVSFCGHTILRDAPLLVPDARADARFHDNPLVAGEPRIRFYAGHPVHSPDGRRIGALCVLDRAPRPPGGFDLAALLDLARIVESELAVARLSRAQIALLEDRQALRERALIDPLTRLWNRGAIFDVLGREEERARRTGEPLSAAMLDVDHFKRVNDQHGHPAGDAVLAEVARRARTAVRAYDAVGRYGGEEFLLLLPGAQPGDAAAVAERVRAEVASTPIEAGGRALDVTVSVGVATWQDGDGARGLLARADAALYAAKRGGRNRVERAAPAGAAG